MTKLCYIARYLTISVLLMWLQALTPVKAQNVVYQGETTTLEVIEVPGESYLWELYQDSTVDFAIVPGDCPPSNATFLGGNTGPSVQVTWLEPGVYFYKITALNITGCTNNLTVGRIVVLEARPTATITPPDPDWLCVGESVFLEVILTGTGPWDFTYTDGTQRQTITGITEPKYLLEVHPKAPTQYWITEVRNKYGVNDKPSAKVWLIVYPRPVSSNIYLTATTPYTGQTYIDEVCTGADRRYRINGEPGSSYDWLLTYVETNQKISLANPKGTAFSATDPVSGIVTQGSELNIRWGQAGTYRLEVLQTSIYGCDTLQHGEVVVYDQPTAIAGNPLSICSETDISLSNSEATNYSSLLWTSSGDGYFENSSVLHARYIIGPNDRIKGSVSLTLTAYGKGADGTCTPASSTLLATFKTIPKMVITTPPSVCLPQAINLSAPSVTAGSDADLDFDYFTDRFGTTALTNYKAIDKNGVYYIRGTSRSSGCSVLDSVKIIFDRAITPSFALVNQLCLNSTPPELPNSSFNGISGYWTPSTISTAVLGKKTYTFEPDPGQCAADTSIVVEVTDQITPTFSFNTSYCQNSLAPELPVISNNGIRGSWSPAVISTTIVGKSTYRFIPDAGQCGGLVTVEITITDLYSPTFNLQSTLCLNSIPPQLPFYSIEGYLGDWQPAVISTSNIGTTLYMFTPRSGQCARSFTLAISIEPRIVPQFDPIGPLCQGSTSTLLTTSKNGITGTWSPSTISTQKPGKTVYNFTPDANWCSESTSLEIEVYEPIMVSAVAGPVATFGGTAKVVVTASGGSGNYTSGIGTFDLTSGSHTFTVTDDRGCSGTKTIFISEPTDLKVTAVNLQPARCVGGLNRVVVSARGGVKPYTYSYTGGNPSHVRLNDSTFLVSASATPYLFRVFDANGLFGQADELLISDPPVLTLSVSSTSPACFGGSDGTATITATNGVPPYTYQWNDLQKQTSATATGLRAGTYTVTVTDQCGPSTATVTVTDPPEIKLTAVGINSLCSGQLGSLQFSFENVPNGNYEIVHNNGKFSNVQIAGNKANVPAAAGTYTNLKLMRNGCSTADGVVATVQSAPEIAVVEFVIQPSCKLSTGTIAITSPQQGTGFVYSIDNKPWQAFASFTGLNPGTYQIKVKALATSCESSPKQVIIQPVPEAPAAPTAQVSIQPTCKVPTGTIVVTSPAEASGYDYSIDNKPWQSSSVFSGLNPGTHQVKVRETATGCESPPTTLTINPALDVPAAPVVAVTAQPDCFTATGSISVNSPKEGTGFEYNIDGGAWQTTATFTNVAPGIHQVKVRAIATKCESGPTGLTINAMPVTPSPPIVSVSVQPSCLINSGTIVVTTPAQGSGFHYSIDGGAYQSSATFTGVLPGEHRIKVKNTNTGCESKETAVTVGPVPDPLPSPVASVTVRPTCTSPFGTIVVTNPAEGSGYVYSLNNGPWQVSATFGGLVSETYRVKVKQVSTGCESETTVVTVDPISKVPPAPVAIVAPQPSCLILTGTIVVNSPLEGSAFEYSLNGGAYQSSDTFLGLAPGIHRIRVKEISTGCESPVITLTVNAPLTAPLAPVVSVLKEPTCNDPNGSVIVNNPREGTGFEYSIDGTNYQPSAIFDGLHSGDYFIRVRKTGTDCVSPDTKINVKGIPPAPVITAVPANSLCFGEDGSISFSITNAVNGTYTINYDGGQFRNVAVTNGKATVSAAARTYRNLTIDANGCSSYDPRNVVTVTITQPTDIIITETITEIDLKTKRKGAIDIQVSGGIGPYRYSWNNGATTQDIDNLEDGAYTITVTDASGCTAQKTMTVPVPNFPPIALPDDYSGGCQMIAGNLLLNDSDPENDPFFLRPNPAVNALHGTVTLNTSDGTFTYVANLGFTGKDSFVYVISDANQYQEARATVTITIFADMDHDGLADDIDADADGDGILNVNETAQNIDWKIADNDGDGNPNYLDIDSDNDGIVDNIEAQAWIAYIEHSGKDVNNNGVDDAYDTDQKGTAIIPIDTEADGIPDLLDPDSDGDGVPDYIEGHDLKAVGKPAHVRLGKDSDGDGLDDGYDLVINNCDATDNMIGSNAEMQDFNNDTKPDWRDDNDDGDKYPTRYEDLNADGDWANDNIDYDEHPEYLDYGRECEMFIPDAFSPNDDNIHDYFQIYCLTAFPDAKMYIFDQLGNKLFEKANYGNLEVWNTPDRAWWTGRQELGPGRSRGDKVPPGTYFYVLDLGNGEVKKSYVFVSY